MTAGALRPLAMIRRHFPLVALGLVLAATGCDSNDPAAGGPYTISVSGPGSARTQAAAEASARITAAQVPEQEWTVVPVDGAGAGTPAEQDAWRLLLEVLNGVDGAGTYALGHFEVDFPDASGRVFAEAPALCWRLPEGCADANAPRPIHRVLTGGQSASVTTVFEVATPATRYRTRPFVLGASSSTVTLTDRGGSRSVPVPGIVAEPALRLAATAGAVDVEVEAEADGMPYFVVVRRGAQAAVDASSGGRAWASLPATREALPVEVYVIEEGTAADG